MSRITSRGLLAGVKPELPPARPAVKFAGGKTKLVPEILSILDKYVRLPPNANAGTFHEPFLGGGAVAFEVMRRYVFKETRLADSNLPLIATYKVIRDTPDRLITELSTGKYTNSEEVFYAIRDEFNETPHTKRNALAIAARFIALNKMCFNGLWRVNRMGRFNVPFGRYDNPTVCDEENLRAVSRALQDVKLYAKDFRQTPVKKGDVIYADPPYIPLNATSSFTSYTKEGFGMSEQISLRDQAIEWKRMGAFVLLSNADTPLTRELYKGWRMKEVSMARAINSVGEKRKKIGELLIW
jgi:DNA adenine methylase